jgi:four helix bundle protein
MGMRFEDLIAWKEARLLVKDIYSMCRDEMLGRDWGLRDQLQRASVSVMTNVAEGFERTGAQEKLQSYNIARASAGEVRSLLYVVEDNLCRGGKAHFGPDDQHPSAHRRQGKICCSVDSPPNLLFSICHLLIHNDGPNLPSPNFRLLACLPPSQ